MAADPSVRIAGAATGIGATYTGRFAHRGHDLVLVARDHKRTEALAARLRQETGVAIDIIQAGLTEAIELAQLEARLRDDARIGVLVNNAGTALRFRSEGGQQFHGVQSIMKAFIVDKYKKRGTLRRGEVLEPALGADDVLVEIHAAGLNPLDGKIRDGAFKSLLPYRPPFVLGHDMAGIVTRVGPNVRQFKAGDEVYARPRDGRIGTLAEAISVNEADLALKPKILSMAEAAAIPLVGLTAWQALVERAGLRKGQRVLIHAGAGGVGTFAIQLAKYLGAVVATTTSTENVELVKSLGTDVVVDYKKQDFEKVLSGYDVVLNSLDGGTLQKSLSVLKPGGKLISISGPPDPDFARQQGMNWFLSQLMRVLSFPIRRKAETRKVGYSFLFMRADGRQLSQITSLIEAGIIRPIVDRTFPFEETNEALAHVDTGRSKGKVVVTLR